MTNNRSYFDFKKSNNSVYEEVVMFLDRIESKNKDFNIFLEVFAEETLNRAKEIDRKIANNTQGKLAGMVVGLKDNICYAGHKVSASSKILQGFESQFSATAVEKLLQEDAIIIGRTNCDEFAMGSSNENSAYGNVKNPLNPSLVPGGSSGGSAAAVAAGFCHVALGSDTGGSIRQPASYCGLVGLRPTYSRISRHGLIAFASSLDIIGTLTNDVMDTALVMEVISGGDEFDATVSHRSVEQYSKVCFEPNQSDKKYKIAVLKECLEADGLDHEVKSTLNLQIEDLKSKGHQVEVISFPYLEAMLPVYYVLAPAEASSNLSRFMGMTYGHRTKEVGSIEETITKSRTEGFGKEVKRRIMLGTFVLSEGFFDAYYTKAQKVRRVVTDYTLELFKTFDFMLLPSTPGTAFEIGQKSADPIAMYLEDIFTIHSAVSGIPAISLPLGNHSNGMPFGIQLMGKPFAESDLLAFSAQLSTNR